MGQFLAAAGLAILVALAGRAPSPVLTMVFNWHGYRAGLDAEGKGGPPVGLHDLRAAGITHVGVPQDHTQAVSGCQFYDFLSNLPVLP